MKTEPLILAIETAVRTGSLSILKGRREIAFCAGEEEVSRADQLLKMIAQILENNSLNLNDIELICVSTGPGSFTGIRIGLSVARALTFGLSCECIGVSVLEALNLNSEIRTEAVISIIPAGRNQFFWQKAVCGRNKHYNLQPPVVGEFDNLIEEIESFAETGISIVMESSLDNLAAKFREVLNNQKREKVYIVASDNMAKLVGINGLYQMGNVPITEEKGRANLTPVYVRGIGASIKKA